MNERKRDDDSIDAVTFSAASDFIEPLAFAPAEQQSQKRQIQIKPMTVVGAIVLLVGLFLVWFLFTAKSVVIETLPKAANLSVSGVMQFKIDAHFLMGQGAYRVNAQLPGYYPIAEFIVVDEQQNQLKQLQFNKLPGQLTVTVHPDLVAQVYIDGQLVGDNLQEIAEVPAGSHEIVVKAEKYFEYRNTIDIIGKREAQALAVTLKPAWFNVNLLSDPAAAQVLSNGAVIGQTPFYGELTEGEYELALQLPGYKPWSRKISAKAGEQINLPQVYLAKNDGKLWLKSDPDAVSVTLDGVYQGKTPLELALTASDSGTDAHQLILFKDGYQPSTRQVKVPSGTSQDLHLTLKPLLGQVKIRTNFKDALLYVDEVLMGRANQAITLTAKQHQIVVKKDGYVDYQTTVLPRPELEQVLNIKLKTLEQQKWELLPLVITTSTGGKAKLFKPKGEFIMGASRREQGRRANEVTRTVAVERPFYLGLTEVTNLEFRQFNKLHSSGNVKGNSLNNDDHPVVNVSWLAAASYCNWLSQQENLPPFYQIEEKPDGAKFIGFNLTSNGYRLPTEAEWVWSSRFINGKMRKYGWGDSLPVAKNYGNFADRSAAAILGFIQADYEDNYIVTAPVGHYAQNEKGLFDLSGNAAEWTSDFYQVKTGLSKTVERDPLETERSDYHVVRGSSWAHGTMTELRLSYRDYGITPRNDIGFRIARFVDPLPPPAVEAVDEATDDNAAGVSTLIDLSQ